MTYSKYGNKRIKTEDGWFDSLAELARWSFLKDAEARGRITGLQRQVNFVLAPSVVIDGRKKPALKYKADFVYQQGGQMVVEDKKGFCTPSYRIKKHLMKSVHGIDIFET